MARLLISAASGALSAAFGALNVSVPVKDLWHGAAKGNKAVEFFTEFAAVDDAYRQGIAVSRLAGIVKLGCERLGHENTAKVIKPEILTKALAEATELMPSLTILNGGKASQNTKGPTLGNMKSTGVAESKEEAEVENAAKATRLEKTKALNRIQKA